MYFWQNQSGEWTPESIEENLLPGPTELRRFPSLGDVKWCLISTDSNVRVNGGALPLGIQVLNHKDEIRVGDEVFLFSTEKLPGIELASGDDLICGRCKKPIAEKTPMVTCPQCGASCHQSEEYPCFNYNVTCPHCDQSTDLNGRFRFHPGEEGW